jgi:hypothetical protein
MLLEVDMESSHKPRETDFKLNTHVVCSLMEA